ncbi:hypothetical protein V1477_017033 [Vespula maculifrons]|uniref:Uncharacterized protein n=2 Tax=Vespula TaxID=7451 RepID=A0A834K653_VESVU|nr:hypothetical protein HZH66_005967 [Vespula vulgaris]
MVIRRGKRFKDTENNEVMQTKLRPYKDSTIVGNAKDLAKFLWENVFSRIWLIFGYVCFYSFHAIRSERFRYKDIYARTHASTHTHSTENHTHQVE